MSGLLETGNEPGSLNGDTVQELIKSSPCSNPETGRLGKGVVGPPPRVPIHVGCVSWTPIVTSWPHELRVTWVAWWHTAAGGHCQVCDPTVNLQPPSDSSCSSQMPISTSAPENHFLPLAEVVRTHENWGLPQPGRDRELELETKSPGPDTSRPGMAGGPPLFLARKQGEGTSSPQTPHCRELRRPSL